MSYARQMLETYPRTWNVDADVLAATIDAADDCAQACAADVAADLSEQNLAEMVRCIRLCLDCADLCTATVGIVSRQGEYDASVAWPLLEACAATCKSCGDECERHARTHEHCRICRDACRRCEQACRELLEAVNWQADRARLCHRRGGGDHQNAGYTRGELNRTPFGPEGWIGWSASTRLPLASSMG